MNAAEITWVCCPAAVADGSLRVAVVVVPRLEPDGDEGELGSFAALADWPSRIAGLRWAVSFLGGPADVASSTVGDPPDSNLWRAVFPAPTPVRTMGTDAARIDRPILSYPAAEVAALVREGYAAAAVAETGDRPATAADALGTAFSLGPLETFRTRLARDGNAPGSGAVARAYAFQQSAARVSDDPPAPPPTLDFHQVLTLLGDHPLLLRRLGLVIDLTVPLAGVDTSVTGIQVSVAFGLPADLAHHLPTTALVVSPGGIDVRVRPRDDGFAAGVWPVDRPEYQLESLDVDDAVRQGVAVASGEATRPDAGPPALRVDGIALVQTGRARALQQQLVDVRERRNAATSTGPGDAAVLDAEDLFRGFRVDVHDDATGVFRSLHARRIRYQVDGFGDLPSADAFVEDEGFSQESPTGDSELHVSERLVTWRGWSLSAPRPDGTRRVERPVPTGDPSITLASLHTHLVCEVRPGTLPRLRFGHSYRFRLRTVDLAGASIPLDGAPATATAELTFLRYEPVLPPTAVSAGASAAFGAGETVARLVIRDPAVVDGIIPLDDTPPPSERLLLPPRSTISLAEQHGLFDDALGNADPGVRTARRALLPRIEQQLDFPVGDTVPYLADPQAVGVAVTGLPGMADRAALRIDFPGDSPDALAPLRLRLETSGRFVLPGQPTSAATYDEASHTLRVFLAAGDRRTVRVSTVLRDPDLMALMQDAGSRLDGAERTALESRVRDSQLTMVTPYAEIELVHATSIPVVSDFTSAVTPRRGAGESTAGLSTTVAVDPRTVDAVEMRATWPEEVDQGPDGLPATITRSATVFSYRLPPDADVTLPAITGDAAGRHQLTLDSDALTLPRHELGTTGHRIVTYRPTSTTRFTDCYPAGSVRVAEGAAADVAILSTVPPPPPAVSDVVPSQIVSPQSEELADPDSLGFVTADAPPPDELPAKAGWTKATQVRAGGGIRVYLDRPWFVSGSGEILGVVLGDPSLSIQPVPGATAGNWAYAENNPVPHWISQVGQDPIRLTPGVQPLTAADFLNVGQTGALSALPDAADAGIQLPVTLLGFRPQFETASGRWYVDIQVNADKAYMPFFRLAVVRYQPMSLNEAISVSRVTTLDVIQPLPTRQLTVIRHAQDPQVTVTLRGITYLEPDTRVSARVTCSLFTAESPMAQHWRPVEGFADVDLPRPQRQPDLTAIVIPTGLTDTVDFWSATLTLPAAEPGQVQRLLVVERDQLRSQIDDEGAGSTRIVHVGTIDL